MKYDHAVKYKGVIYPTGADVPVEETPVIENIEVNPVEDTPTENKDTEEVKIEVKAKTTTKKK